MDGQDKRKMKSKDLAAPAQEEVQFTNEPEASTVETSVQTEPSVETIESERATVVDYPESTQAGPETVRTWDEEVEGVSEATTVVEREQWDQETGIDPIPELAQPISNEGIQSMDRDAEDLSQ